MEAVKPIQPNFQQEKSNFARNAVLATTTAGGAVYGADFGMKRFVSDADAVKINKMEPTPKNFFNKVADCFNMEKAAQALKDKKINQETFDKVDGYKKAAIKKGEAEEQVRKVLDMPFEKRLKSLKETVKEAKKAARDFTKKNFALRKDSKKLVELNIVDVAKHNELAKEGMVKTKKVMKILAKPVAMGAAIFASIGLIAGIGINSLFPKKQD